MTIRQVSDILPSMLNVPVLSDNILLIPQLVPICTTANIVLDRVKHRRRWCA